MRYYEVSFDISAPEEQLQDARDLLAALAGEAGFETFEETTAGLKGYVQTTLLQTDVLDAVISDFPLPGIHIIYNVHEADYRDWNEDWEQAGFEPINIDNRLCIHCHGREDEPTDAPIVINIDARQAFGTGTHETTRMVVSTLLDLNLQGKRILDCGCGTGILGIAAMKMGAEECVGYDIDEWSVKNTLHNADLNHVDITAIQGDAGILKELDKRFDVVVANINRNILLADLPTFRQMMANGGTIILSGFYTEDVPLLQEKGKELGLRVVKTKEDNHWACLLLS